MIYLFIFVAKVIEISLGTLRMIVIANGKKWLGAILQLASALVWIFSTEAVLVGILGAKIYRMGTLRYGNPIKISTAIKAIRNKEHE